jgi:DNA-binding PadR family transcriptional regulator
MTVAKRKYNPIKNKTIRMDILEIIKSFPNITSTEIAEFIPTVKRVTIMSALSNLRDEGVVEVTGVKTTKNDVRTYNLNTYALATGAEKTAPAPTPAAAVTESTAALHAQIHSLKAALYELELWKQEAVARYPDLTVDPIVLKARRLVANEVRDSGDHNLADRILSGMKDDGLMMRVTIKAMEAANV